MYKYTDEERNIIGCACYDCGLKYGGAGWIDAVIDNKYWEIINPSYHNGAGLLCITCIAKRLELLGLSNIEVSLNSGPLICLR